MLFECVFDRHLMKFTCAHHRLSNCVKHRYMAQMRPSPLHLRLPSRPYASCCTSGTQVNFTKIGLPAAEGKTVARVGIQMNRGQALRAARQTSATCHLAAAESACRQYRVVRWFLLPKGELPPRQGAGSRLHICRNEQPAATSNLRNKQPAATSNLPQHNRPPLFQHRPGKGSRAISLNSKFFRILRSAAHNATAVLHSTPQRHNTTTPQSRVTAQRTTESHGTQSTQQHQQHTAACYSTRQPTAGTLI